MDFMSSSPRSAPRLLCELESSIDIKLSSRSKQLAGWDHAYPVDAQNIGAPPGLLDIDSEIYEQK